MNMRDEKIAIVLQLVLDHGQLDILDVRQLCSVSRTCEAVVRQHIKSNACPLIVQSAYDVSLASLASTSDREHQLLSAVEWLIKIADDHMHEGIVAALTKIPMLIEDVVRPARSAGMHVTLQQLAAAAKCHVVGVESWVARFHHEPRRREQMALPSIVTSILTGSKQLDLASVTAANLPDVLLIAVQYNVSAAVQLLDYILQPASSNAVQELQHQISPDLLEHILKTAVHKASPQLVRRLMQMPALGEISSKAAAEVLLSAIGMAKRPFVMQELCTPQLTALLDSKSCEAVLQRAVARNDRHALRLLCRCNVAQAMDVAAVERLISAAVHMGATSSAEGVNAHALIKHLSMLPGAEEMPPACIASLVQAAMHGIADMKSRLSCIHHLLKLPTAVPMDADTCQDLLHSALLTLDFETAQQICDELAQEMQQLNSTAIQSLIGTVILQFNYWADEPDYLDGAVALVQLLCQLPAAADVDPEALIALAHQMWAPPPLLRSVFKGLPGLDASKISRLLGHSLQRKDLLFAKFALEAPAAQQLEAERIGQLLLEVLRDRDVSAVPVANALLQLPNAIELQSSTLAELLQAAVVQHLDNIIEDLMKLPASDDLSAAQLSDLLSIAVQHHLSAAVCQFCSAQAAQQIPKQILTKHLQQAMQLHLGHECVQQLCAVLVAPGDTPAADSAATRELDRAAFTAVLQLAVSTRHLQSIVALLDGHAAAQQLDREHVVQLLQHAVQQQVEPAVTALCRLDASQGFTPTDLMYVLEAVFRASNSNMFEALLSLPAAACFPAASVHSLLLLCLRAEWLEGMQLIRQHMPAAGALPAHNCEALVSAAVQQMHPDAVVCLLQLQCMQCMPADAVKRLLHQALRVKDMESAAHLCELPAANNISARDMEELLVQAFRIASRGTIIACLFELSAVHELSSSSLAKLSMLACSTATGGTTLPMLLGLPNAQGVDLVSATAILQAGVQQQSCSIVECVCKLPCIQQLPAQDVLRLLQAVLQQTTEHFLTQTAGRIALQLLRNPGAAGIPAEDISGLLHLGAQCLLSVSHPRVVCELLKLHAAAVRLQSSSHSS